jgi:hypothetical protein
MSESSFAKHSIEIIGILSTLTVITDRHKLLQIMIN